jgi:hypothetical protein
MGDGAAGIISISFNATCPACTAVCGPLTSGSAGPSTSKCTSGGARAVPSSYGLQIWSAAHPQNPQHVDLVIAPAAFCAALSASGVCDTAAANTVVGEDGVTRYVVGTAARFNMEPAETLTCSAS